MMFIDARVPVRFGGLSERRAGEAVLSDVLVDAPGPWARFDGGDTRPEHAKGCVCCIPRGGAGLALGALFRERALGTGVAFSAVLAVVSPAGEAAVRACLVSDAFAAGRYRLG